MEEQESFWSKHKKTVYVVGACVVCVGAGVALGTTLDIKNIQINIGWKNRNTVKTTLSRRGHPGYICKDLVSGAVGASKNHLREMLGLTWSEFEKRIASGDILVLGEASAS